jgi:hypothetical protein
MASSDPSEPRSSRAGARRGVSLPDVGNGQEDFAVEQSLTHHIRKGYQSLDHELTKVREIDGYRQSELCSMAFSDGKLTVSP